MGSFGTVFPAGTVDPTPCKNRASGYLEGVPGQPMWRTFDKLVRETVGWDALGEMYADGEYITVIAERFGVSRSWLSPRLHKRLRALREKGVDYYVMRGEALEERNAQDAQDVPAERDEIAKAKLVIEQRHRLAVAADPATWGDKPNAAPIQILSTGDLHLLAVSDPNVAREARQRFLQSQPAPKALPSGQET